VLAAELFDEVKGLELSERLWGQLARNLVQNRDSVAKLFG
jgi:hypothetical protein